MHQRGGARGRAIAQGVFVAFMFERQALAIVAFFGGGDGRLYGAKRGVAVSDVFDRRLYGRGHFLGDVGYGEARLHVKVAGLRMQLAQHKREQARFAAAVGANKSDAHAGVNHQVDIAQQHFDAALQGEFAQSDQIGMPGRKRAGLYGGNHPRGAPNWGGFAEMAAYKAGAELHRVSLLYSRTCSCTRFVLNGTREHSCHREPTVTRVTRTSSWHAETKNYPRSV